MSERSRGEIYYEEPVGATPQCVVSGCPASIVAEVYDGDYRQRWSCFATSRERRCGLGG
jgi:hypothetical protein